MSTDKRTDGQTGLSALLLSAVTYTGAALHTHIQSQKFRMAQGPSLKYRPYLAGQ